MDARLAFRLLCCPVTLHFSGRWTMLLPTLWLAIGGVMLTVVSCVGAWLGCVGLVKGGQTVLAVLGLGFVACRWLLGLSGVWNWWITKEWRTAVLAWLFALVNGVVAYALAFLWTSVVLSAAPNAELLAARLLLPSDVEVWYPANHPDAVGAQKRTDGVFSLALETSKEKNALGAEFAKWRVCARWPEETLLEICPVNADVSLFGPVPLPQGEPLMVDRFALRMQLAAFGAFNRAIPPDVVRVRVYPKAEPSRTLVERYYLLSVE